MKKQILSLSTAILILLTTATAQKNPGDDMPNVKYLDVEFLGPFSGGAAIVKKGDKKLLIDTAGNILLPIGSYSALDYAGDGMGNPGFFLMEKNDNNRIGTEKFLINAKGKVIFDLTKYNQHSQMFSLEGKYFLLFSVPQLKREPYPCHIFDIHGNRTTITIPYMSRVQKMSCGRILVTDSKEGSYVVKYGFRNLKGDYVVKPIYDYAKPYVEGMAVVGVKDEFGAMKYGFVDTAGNLAIKLIFSNEPSDFKGGASTVTPKDNADFYSAFVNMSGRIFATQNEQTRKAYVQFNEFRQGYCIAASRQHILDTSGRVITKGDFLKSFGINFKFFNNPNDLLLESSPSYPFMDKIILNIRNSHGIETVGIIRPQQRTGMLTQFTFIPPTRWTFFTDPVSKLEYVRLFMGRNKDRDVVYKEGFVNEQGYFVIVKAKAQGW